MLDADARPFCSPDTPPQWVRPRRFRIDHVDLAVAIDLDARRVAGNVTHAVAMLPHGDAQRLVELDQHGLEILGTWIDGAAVPFSVAPGTLAIAVPPGVVAAFSLRVAFRATAPAKGMFFIPADPARGQVAMCWTQGAMEDHSHWFPCFDSPNNLSTYHFAIRHRSGLAAVANGEPAGITDHGDGWATTTYDQAKAHVLYLVNVVVGDLVAVADGTGTVPIAHWLPRGKEDGASAMFRATAFAIRWLGDYIGVPFAWSRYGHVVVHGFMWGGMENTTLTTITDRVLMDSAVQTREDVDADSLVVHELVHQWFGDLLTMKGWADIWLNESFATYLEARGTAAWKAHSAGYDAADHLALELWGNRAAYLEEDSGRYRRALVTNRYVDAYELFDRVAYEKGSLVLHYLCCYLGEERFRAALALYTRRHAHDLVETADWRQALEDATGEPLDWFFDQWVHRAGHPCLKIRWRHDPARGQLIVEVEQTQAAGPDQVFRLPTVLAWGAADGGAARIAVDLTKAKQTLVVPLATAPRWVALDPDGTIPGEWDEAGDSAQILARAGDAALGAQARARALVAVGTTVPGAT
ncbi:MAG: hypothetical protein H0X38_12500, partial [Planctomycetes bacterium]|nr:hypothetical protein [Planctomycetota bacterium]